MFYFPMKMKRKAYYYLIISALGLTGLGVLIAGFLLYGLNHPEAFRREIQAQMVEEVPASPEPSPVNEIVDGIDVATGFVAEGDYLLVKSTCTACHSAKLVTQNRATREGWEEMIRWMQATQKLWDLGETEGPILDYLAEHYSPEYQGRRANLAIEEWYQIP
jgi:hypothetical protein